ncbi:glycoside hydrolase family 65 protein (plasmid) [Legionella lytica]|uniref:Glycoside hydrolase family 65 protein n=1 Tax=Legionella lytica TaxID=96232 RepID=A0ABY4YCT2_9GAMM|nr:glycosyl hydrolase family 65 protein [Legionella lytica]USQ15416.1 glycoside hydrolase family 65 protein [Legionella lytica]
MNPWIISYRSFNDSSIRLKETLFTLGNGYVATRGTFEDSKNPIHYAGTYLAGGYNRNISQIANQNLINEDLVNCPNWLPLTFKVEEEDWFEIADVTLLSFKEMLHLKKGLLKRSYRIRDMKGRIFVINSLRFLSQHNPHLGGIRYSITSENWSGKITIRSSLYGEVINNGVPRYQELNSQHLEITNKGISEEKYLYLQARMLQSHLEISEAITTKIYKNHQLLNCSTQIKEETHNIHVEFELILEPYQKITVYKLISIFHSKDCGISENLYDAIKLLTCNSNYKQLLKQHMLAWSSLWDRADVKIEGAPQIQQLIRFHIFHTLQSLSKHSIHVDCGAPARGLHGEAYRGHVFWDELFILPFFFFNFPEIARSLLMYRYHRLNSARLLAHENGFQGAMFPWQSASNGEEETQKVHLNPKSGKWGPDQSSRQRHVNMAIAYNIWNYYVITNDEEFLHEYGAEIILEIAKFINSMTIYNPSRNKFEIHGVMGPDEYHEQGMDPNEIGLKNNTYTNIMAVWVLEKALELKNILTQNQYHYLVALLGIKESETNRWKNIIKNMFIPFHENVLSQFEGYEHLKPFDWATYQKKYALCERLDRILKAEDKNSNEYQIAKQPDTLMLYYLLEEKELIRLFHQLGYEYSDETTRRTIDYYLSRTSHGSTLSKMTLASILIDKNMSLAKKLYQEALNSDIEDTQGGTTEEGIHLGVMAGTISLLTKNISGVNFYPHYFSLNPQLPSWIKRLTFKLVYHQNLYEIELFQTGCSVKLINQRTNNLKILIKGKLFPVLLNKKITIFYQEISSSTCI